MKLIAIFGLWVFLGWDVGAWAEAFVGVPAFIGITAGVAVGAALAVEARRRMAAAPARGARVALRAQSESAVTLDRAA